MSANYLLSALTLLALACAEAPTPSLAQDGALADTKGHPVDTGDTGPGGSDGGADPGDAIRALSDEFDNAASLDEWSIFHEEEGLPNTTSILDIDTTSLGSLVIVASSGGWYMDGVGPYLYKEVSGDFVVMMRVRAGRRGAPYLPPTRQYNSAGMVVRDPASPWGAQDWVMYDIGMQDGRVGSEGKTTVNSYSTLYITEGASRGLIAICRRGQTIRMLRLLDGESEWVETETFQRPDLGETLQAGPIVNAWETPADLYAEFDWIRFAPVESDADCTAVPPPL